MRKFEPVVTSLARNTSFIFLNMEVLQVNSPLSQANSSEKKNWVGHLNTIFALGGRNLNKTIFKRSNARGISRRGGQV